MGFCEISDPISEPEEMASLTSEVRNGQKGDTLGVLVNVRGCTERGGEGVGNLCTTNTLMLPVQLSQQIELIIATTNLTYYALRGERAGAGHPLCQQFEATSASVPPTCV